MVSVADLDLVTYFSLFKLYLSDLKHTNNTLPNLNIGTRQHHDGTLEVTYTSKVLSALNKVFT